LRTEANIARRVVGKLEKLAQHECRDNALELGAAIGINLMRNPRTSVTTPPLRERKMWTPHIAPT